MIRWTIENSDDIEHIFAESLSPVSAAQAEMNLKSKNIQNAVTKWLRNLRYTGTKRSFAEAQGVSWNTFNKFTVNDPKKRRLLPIERKVCEKKTKYANRQYPNNYCCIDNCDGNDLCAKFIRVPDPPLQLPNGASAQRQRKYQIKNYQWREHMEHMGKRRGCVDKGLCVYKKHLESVTGKFILANICQAGGSTVNENIAIPTFEAHRRVGGMCINAPPTTLLKGNALDRAIIQFVNKLSNVPGALLNVQLIEMEDVTHGKHKLSVINPLVLAAAGLHVHINDGDAK